MASQRNDDDIHLRSSSVVSTEERQMPSLDPPSSPPPHALFNPFAPASTARTAPRKRSGLRETSTLLADCSEGRLHASHSGSIEPQQHFESYSEGFESIVTKERSVLSSEFRILDVAEKKQAKQPRFVPWKGDSKNIRAFQTAGSSLPGEVTRSVSIRALSLPDYGLLSPSNETSLGTSSESSDEMLSRTPPDKISPWFTIPPTPMAPKKDYKKARPIPLRKIPPLRLDFGAQENPKPVISKDPIEHGLAWSKSLPASSNFSKHLDPWPYGESYVGSAPSAVPEFPVKFCTINDSEELFPEDQKTSPEKLF